MRNCIEAPVINQQTVLEQNTPEKRGFRVHLVPHHGDGFLKAARAPNAASESELFAEVTA